MGRSDDSSSDSSESGPRRRDKKKAKKLAKKELKKQKKKDRKRRSASPSGDRRSRSRGRTGSPDNDPRLAVVPREQQKDETETVTDLPPNSRQQVVNRWITEKGTTCLDADGNEVEMEQPNFEVSGLLAMEDAYEREQKLVHDHSASGGVGVGTRDTKKNFRTDLQSGSIAESGKFSKASLPMDAALPPGDTWRLYIFQKDGGDPKIAYLAKKPDFLFGKDRKVADVPTDHPSCSKQHAVLHFRTKKLAGRVGGEGEAGAGSLGIITGRGKVGADVLTGGQVVVPYVMDLESTNGTFLNGERLEPCRYYELLPKDRLNFATSTRDYILMKK
eukprot:g9837.t1